ncbi:VCBS repeat-containing protein [Candidatus Dojkabacteria bacterium]|uniref:VCBS repeat-containing protein n=1 Tax=Candidatus Dojkabacteria bacterium TaxID=2099670 RepID=A0A955I4X8_9BACT|nr:VCBS repeat-containing protein [Candidatus Dojkabacteria bacterium]
MRKYFLLALIIMPMFIGVRSVGATLYTTPPAIAPYANDYEPCLNGGWWCTIPGSPGHGFDAWGFYDTECVSYAAWRLNYESGRYPNASHFFFSNYGDGGSWGFGSNWDVQAISLGYRVDNIPARGAIRNNSIHVQYVEFVHNATGNLTVDVSDYNGADRDHLYGYRTNVSAGGAVYIHIPGMEMDLNPTDYDGDGKTDIAVFREGSMTRYIQQSTNGQTRTETYGATTDIPVFGSDYDHDGKEDLAVFRASTGTWYIHQSSAGSKQVSFGSSTDKPLGGVDYDGDGLDDIAVYRRSNHTTYVLQSRDGYREIQFGTTGDVPVFGADYDGDGKTDTAIFRPGNQVIYIIRSSLGYQDMYLGGIDINKVIPINAGDFDGDGKDDIVLFNPNTATRHVWKSTGGTVNLTFGSKQDIPIHGADYDGDGIADLAVFRPSEAKWYMQQSGAGSKWVVFGAPTDRPI